MADRGISIVRVYDDRGRSKGDYRVLVDRLWPRGLTREAVDHDEWAKDVAPSTELRRWYGHAPDRFPEFRRRYRDELDAAPASQVVSALKARASEEHLVLLTATRDVEHSAAVVLRDVLEGPGA